MLTNITIKYFPPNTTSVLQPLDQGIINNFKTIYRTKYVNKLIAQMDALEVIEEKLNVKDAIDDIVSSWMQIKKKTINNCFKTEMVTCSFLTAKYKYKYFIFIKNSIK